MRLKHNVRLVAKEDIAAGEEFTWKNVGIYRAVKELQEYINPMEWEQVIGKVAKSDVKAWSSLATSQICTARREAEPLHT